MDGYANSEIQGVRLGDEQLRLVLQKGGVVRGRVLADPCVRMDQVRYWLEATEGRSSELRWEGGFIGDLHQQALGFEGKFSAPGVSMKEVDLHLSIQGWEGPVIKGITARLESADPDPRLDPLDIRGSWTCFTIAVQDDLGNPAAGVRITLRPAAGDDEIEREFTPQAGRAELIVPSGMYDVDIEREGWRTVHLSNVAEDRTVRLRRGLPVRIVLDPAPIVPPPPYRLLVALTRPIFRNHVDVEGIGFLDASGQATVPVSSPGVYEVAWYLQDPKSRRFLYGIPSRRVEVLDREDPQEIRLEARAEIRTAWQQKIREIEKD